MVKPIASEKILRVWVCMSVYFDVSKSEGQGVKEDSSGEIL